MDPFEAALGFWNTFAGRTVVVFGLAVLAHLLLVFVTPIVTRRTHFEFDDIIVGVLRWPLPVIIVLSGLASAVELIPLPEGLLNFWSHGYLTLLAIVAAYLVFKITSGIIVRYSEEYSRKSESNLDDVLVPLLTRKVFPTFIAIAGAIAVLWGIGVELSSVVTVIGALSFLLVFLFQEPLSNLFSGVFLALDVPFKYGDLLMLEDEKTYRVEEIGGRVTRLYKTDDHTLAYIPNNKLAAQRLINLTRPNVELRQRLQIGVAYGTKDFAKVQEILLAAANAHPHVLGDFESKTHEIQNLIEQTPASPRLTKLVLDMDRLSVEQEIRLKCESLVRQVEVLHRFVRGLELNGIDTSEELLIRGHLDSVFSDVDELRIKLTIWLHLIAHREVLAIRPNGYRGHTSVEIEQRLPEPGLLERWRKGSARHDEIKTEMLSNGRLAVLGTFPSIEEEFYLAGSESWLAFSQEVAQRGSEASLDAWKQGRDQDWAAWATYRDYYGYYQDWHKPVRDLLIRLEECRKPVRKRGGDEFRLDERLREVVHLLETKFLLRVPAWQLPVAAFVGFGASSIDFSLQFFVDSLSGEHYTRIRDVYSEVGLDIMRRFGEEGIEIPFQQMDVWLRDRPPEGMTDIRPNQRG